jgi:hypothetical protein
MNLGDFQAELKAEIKRGDSYDARLPNLIRRAARWIEQNYTFQYMRRRFEVDTAAGENVIGLPANVPIKSIIYLRFDAPDGTRYEVAKGDLSDEEWTGPILRYESTWAGKVSTFPTLFYLDGVENLVFNRPFQEVITGQGMMARYSDFPKAAQSDPLAPTERGRSDASTEPFRVHDLRTGRPGLPGGLDEAG